jgi:hypothetical protein
VVTLMTPNVKFSITVSGLCPWSTILKHSVLETGSVSVLQQKIWETSSQLGPLDKPQSLGQWLRLDLFPSLGERAGRALLSFIHYIKTNDWH